MQATPIQTSAIIQMVARTETGGKQTDNDRGLWNPPRDQAGVRAAQPVTRPCVGIGAHGYLPCAAGRRAALARTLGLNGRARHRAVGTEHATVAGFRAQRRTAPSACVEKLAC